MNIYNLINEMQSYVVHFLNRYLPEISKNWWQNCVIDVLEKDIGTFLELSKSSSLNNLDFMAIIKVIDKNWRNISKLKSFPRNSIHYIKEMRIVRNNWAHEPVVGYNFDIIFRDLDTMERFAKIIQAPSSFIDKIKYYKESMRIHEDDVKKASRIIRPGSKFCACGCGGEVVSRRANFISGHDGRVSGWFRQILNGRRKVSDLNPEAQKLWNAWNELGRPGGENHPRLKSAAEKVYGER